MQDCVNKKSLTAPEIARMFQEFDVLWEMPSTPERRSRMESILQMVEQHQAPVVDRAKAK